MFKGGCGGHHTKVSIWNEPHPLLTFYARKLYYYMVTMSKKYPILDDYDWLYTKYIKEELSTIAIAKIVGCYPSSITDALKKKEIPIRSYAEASRIQSARELTLQYPILDDYDWLYTKYIKEALGSVRIAKIVGCGSATILKELKKKGIPIRSRHEGAIKRELVRRIQNYPILNDYTWLYKKYRIERVTCEELAVIIGCTHETVLRALRRLNIPIYTNSESKISKNKWSEDRKKAVRGKNHPWYGKTHTEETKKKISRIRKEHLKNPEFAKKMFKATAKRPTKPEKRCCEIFQKKNLPYKYVGDGGVVIGNKCPDFIHLTKKIVIEVFGRAFHSPLLTFRKSMPYHQTYDGTMAHYKKHGYKCVIIWDTDLDREDAEAFVLLKLKKAKVI